MALQVFGDLGWGTGKVAHLQVPRGGSTMKVLPYAQSRTSF